MKRAIQKLGIGSLLLLSAFVPASAQQAPAQPVIFLNQAWSQEDREWYYNFSQGSAIVSYDIYLNLDRNSRLGFLGLVWIRVQLIVCTTLLHNLIAQPIGLMIWPLIHDEDAVDLDLAGRANRQSRR